jgi:hypothetical protein
MYASRNSHHSAICTALAVAIGLAIGCLDLHTAEVMVTFWPCCWPACSSPPAADRLWAGSHGERFAERTMAARIVIGFECRVCR